MSKKIILAATIIFSANCMYYDGEDNGMRDDGEDNGLQFKDHTFDPSFMGSVYDIEVLPSRPQELNSERAFPNSMLDDGDSQTTTQSTAPAESQDHRITIQQDPLMQADPQEDLELGGRRMTLSLSGWPMPQDGEYSPV